MRFRNAGLFSDHFLANRVRQMPDWSAVPDAELRQLQSGLEAILQAAAPGLSAANEAQTERDVVRPFLDLLGHEYDVQTGLPAWPGRRVPDYAIFDSPSTRQQALPLRGLLDFWDSASALVDAKGWSVGLDQVGAGGTNKTPGQQVAEYLRESSLTWGVVTNGRAWRLYARVRGRLASQYFEIETQDALADTETLRLFLLVFGPRGLREDPLHRRFCELLLDESVRYAIDIGDRLRDRAFPAVEALARGFARSMGAASLSRARLDDIYSNSLVLLYRLLFILSAEARGLLPLDNAAYRHNHSLTERRHELLGRRERNELLGVSTALYAELTALFHLVDVGDPAANIPPYNGGLFSVAGHPFLTEHACPDPEVVEAIVDLVFDHSAPPQAIDYRDIAPRHLGTIYEGLLEFRLEVAAQDLAVGRSGGVDFYRPARANETVAVPAGQLYLRNDKNQRRATGSYYTPDYIVDYMVQNALAPLLNDRSDLAKRLLADDADDLARQLAARDALLNIRVLDPACGSGHFLVAAMHEIADAIYTDPSFIPAEADPDGRLLRRRVAERCLFGTDFNPLALELTRLTVWLESVAPDRPLSFLDHHLRFGDALIGAWIDDVAALQPGPRGTYNFAQDALRRVMPGILSRLVTLSATDARTLPEIHQKQATAATVESDLAPYRELADYWLAGARFRQPADQTEIDAAVHFLAGRGGTMPSSTVWNDAILFSRAMKAFHWELEFPEVFFDANGDPASNAGFDVVLGNPPYEVLETRQSDFASPGGMTAEDRTRYQRRRDELTLQRAYFRGGGFPAETSGGKLDLFRLFIERNLRLLASGGAVAQIVPRSLLADESATGVRSLLWQRTQLERIDVFPKDPPGCWVFPDAELAVAVFVARQSGQLGTAQVRRQACRQIASGPFETVTIRQAMALDSRGAPIPVAVPGDIALAMRLYNCRDVCRIKGMAPCHIGEVNSEGGRPYFRDARSGAFQTLLIRGGDIGRHWIEERSDQAGRRWLDVQAFAASRPQGSSDWQSERVAKQAITDLSDPRRLVAALLPSGRALQDSADYLVAPGNYSNGFLLAVLLADVNEWRFRLTSSNNNVNAYEVDELFFPQVTGWTAPNRSQSASRLKDGILASTDDPVALVAVVRQHLAGGASRAALHDVADELTREASAALAAAAGTLRAVEMTLLSFRRGDQLPQQVRRGRWIESTDQDLLTLFTDRRVETTLQQRQTLLVDLGHARQQVDPLRHEVRHKERAAEAIVHAMLALTDAELALVRADLPTRPLDLAPVWS
ncbi:hypothetical protein AYO39_00195 [Actinobacteria bacterium SCGC AG-212-D09]|nr:hypothetical protein AYO39_00195 [Actinobacteria bacterium SCGC AG-212-D09]